MSVETITKALQVRRTGVAWMARCPAHDDREPSLSINAGKDGKVLVRCHAGCAQRDVIAALRERSVWETTGKTAGKLACKHRHQTRKETDPGALKRTEAALSIWQASQPAQCTPVEIYLRSRGLALSPPPVLRFHARLKHPSGGVWPAMVALVTHGDTGLPIAIHRTFLAPNGSGKAPVDPVKMMLGPCRGGVVRLTPVADVLMVGEGIETCFAAMQATGRRAWAAPLDLRAAHARSSGRGARGDPTRRC